MYSILFDKYEEMRPDYVCAISTTVLVFTHLTPLATGLNTGKRARTRSFY